MTRPLKVFAPAKVNLCLHVTGKRDNGYHELDSLVAFADIGDHLIFQPHHELALDIQGQFARSFLNRDRIATRDSQNLVIRAAHMMADTLRRDVQASLILQKNIPLGAGLGGGSADAAACLWGLLQWWGTSYPAERLEKIANQLGSDVQACIKSQPARMQGTGDIVTPLAHMPEMPVVLLWPNQICETAPVYQHWSQRNAGHFSDALPALDGIETQGDLIRFLMETRNDLRSSAVALHPVIAEAELSLQKQKGCAFARMSGSGSAVFGLFETVDQAQAAVEDINRTHKDWWARSGWINRTERY